MGGRDLGRVFDDVPELYDRVRPGYPDELFADLVRITGIDEPASVLEVGCGTGQATRSLAALGCSVTAVEPGAGMAALARQRVSAFHDADVEFSTFEEWDDRGRRFDALVAATSWHWVDPSVGWPRAHAVLASRCSSRPACASTLPGGCVRAALPEAGLAGVIVASARKRANLTR